MKCPVCQAKLLPVDGEMFCLQCGAAVEATSDGETPEPIEDTTDPLLQRAIVDAVNRDVAFPASLHVALSPPKTAGFASLHSFLKPRPTSAEPSLQSSAMNPPLDQDVKIGAASLNLLPEISSARSRFWQSWPMVWLLGFIIAAGFVALNAGIWLYYHDRVYPGVKVGQLSLGGLEFSQLPDVLRQNLARSEARVQIAGTEYALPASVVTESDLGAVAHQASDVGHTTPLPLAGLVQAWFSRPLSMPGLSDDDRLRAIAGQLARRAALFRPTNAALMVVEGRVVLIDGKAGAGFDEAKAVEAIRAAYASAGRVNLETVNLEPLTRASAYDAEVQALQSRLALRLRLSRRLVAYSPTTEQLGAWLVVNGPGKGVSIDRAAVADYIGLIPGRFDRAAAVAALVSALTDAHDLDYPLVTTKSTVVPSFSPIPQPTPLISYRYCLSQAGNDGALAARVAATLGHDDGWALQGSVGFAAASADCNFAVELRPPAEMAKLNPACLQQATCEVGNRLLISTEAWKAAPAGWRQSLEAYQTELINHEVGHWLGFDHPSCLGSAQAKPVLAEPTIVLTGCSPNWYAVPFEILGTKALNPF